MSLTNGSVQPSGLLCDLKELLAFIGRGLKLEMLGILAGGACDVSTMSEEIGLSVSLVSRNLCQMAERGLLEVTLDKQRHIYSIRKSLTITVGERGEHLFLSTRDGGWVLLHLPLRKNTNTIGPLPLAMMRDIARTIENQEAAGLDRG